MQAVILIGLQASGKSSFYHARFARTHLHLSLDLLKTRNRETRLLNVCWDTQLSFVIDNTNPTRADRARYLIPAKMANFRTLGYYFESKLEACLLRNAARAAEQQVPRPGLLATFSKLERPAREEGFDELYSVTLVADGQFQVEEWRDEVFRPRSEDARV